MVRAVLINRLVMVLIIVVLFTFISVGISCETSGDGSDGQAVVDSRSWVLIDTDSASGIWDIWGTSDPNAQYSLSGVWGSSSSDDVFAVGFGGTIIHYNGSAWDSMSQDTSYYLKDVWGSSSQDVFVVGGHGTIYHYNGDAWTEMNSATTNTLLGVWGSSSSDVFAVGDDATVLHYDGENWSRMTSGIEGEGFVLNGIWGSSHSNVFAVGGNPMGMNGPILHYDGSTWSSISTSQTGHFNDVWGSSSSDVFIVGDKLNLDSIDLDLPTFSSVTLHFDGKSWSSMDEELTDTYLFSVWGYSSSDVYAVGSQGIWHFSAGLSVP